jgi:hypothetical protein
VRRDLRVPFDPATDSIVQALLIHGRSSSKSETPALASSFTSEDEWYKAAYYDPTTESYFDYGTSSSTLPLAEAPPGGVNSANYGASVLGTPPVDAPM